jgi:SulP family sulfate permease
VPLCSLAAILFIVAYNMSDVPHFIRIIKVAPNYDVLVMVCTFLLTIFTNLVVAVNVGVILAMLFFIRRMNQSMGIEQQTQESLQAELISHGISALPNSTLVYSIQGPFFFGVAEKIEHTLATIHADPTIIIFRLRDVPFMDMTGLETFNELIEHYHKRGTQVYLCEANPKVAHKLNNIGILHWIAENRIFNNFGEILKTIAKPA